MRNCILFSWLLRLLDNRRYKKNFEKHARRFVLHNELAVRRAMMQKVASFYVGRSVSWQSDAFLALAFRMRNFESFINKEIDWPDLEKWNKAMIKSVVDKS